MPAPLARRVAPDAVVPAELVALLVDDRAVGRLEATPLEEGPVVVAGEEARLLALAALGGDEARRRGLGARLRLRQLPERELDPVELSRVERGEHVGLVLVRIGARARAAAGRRARRSARSGRSRASRRRRARRRRAARRSGSRRCSGRTGSGSRPRAYDSTKGSTTARRNSSRRSSVTCGSPSAVAGLARGDHGLRRAAGALGVGAGRVEPEPERDADRLRPGAEQRDGAVDAAAHRNRDPAGIGRGGEDLGERVRERVGSERLAGDRGRLEQRQAGERPRQSRRVGFDDPVAVDGEPHECKLGSARGVSEDLDHARSLAANGQSARPPKAASRVFARSGSLPQIPILRNKIALRPCRCFLAPMRTCLTRWVPCRTSTGEV